MGQLYNIRPRGASIVRPFGSECVIDAKHILTSLHFISSVIFENSTRDLFLSWIENCFTFIRLSIHLLSLHPDWQPNWNKYLSMCHIATTAMWGKQHCSMHAGTCSLSMLSRFIAWSGNIITWLFNDELHWTAAASVSHRIWSSKIQTQ